MFIFYKIFITTAIILSFLGCGGSTSGTNSTQTNSNNNQTTTPTSVKSYSFRNDVMPIFIRKCQACHGNSGNFKVTTVAETYRLLLQDAPRASTGYAHFIVPKDINQSLAYKKALNIELHGGGAQLPYDSPEALIVKEWILQGARLDNLKITWAWSGAI